MARCFTKPISVNKETEVLNALSVVADYMINLSREESTKLRELDFNQFSTQRALQQLFKVASEGLEDRFFTHKVVCED